MESLEPLTHSVAERRRLAALADYGVLGTPPEESFSRLARLAQRMFAVPGVLIGFVGERRVYYKANLGLSQRSYPRAESLCASAAFADEALVFFDLQAKPQASLAFVRQNGVRFYAAVPLRSEAGEVLGALSLFDKTPRDFDAAQLEQLKDIAAAVLELLAARLGRDEGARGSVPAGKPLDTRREAQNLRAHLAELLEVAPGYAFIANADGALRYANQAARTALALDTLPEGLADLYPASAHPALGDAFAEALATGQARLETELLTASGQTVAVAQGFSLNGRPGEKCPSVSILSQRLESSRWEHLERQRTEVLELTARGAPLPAVLLQLSRFLEANCAGTHAAVSLLLEGALQLEAAPTLPSAFARILNDVPLASAGGSGLAAQTGERVISADIRRDRDWRNLRYFALQHGLLACWSEPILSEQGAVLGVFALYLNAPREPSEHELRLLREVVGLAAIAISRQQLYRELERAARYDPLTGLPNRRYLGQYMERALERAEREIGLVGVLMLDLNDFKQVNDSLGHSAGDLLLKEVALRLRAALPPQAKVARSGGDEFVVVLELEHRDDAARVAFEITEALTRPFVLEARRFNLGASIGISLYPDDAQDAETLLKTADIAMYAAKAESKLERAQGYRRYLPEMTQALDAQLQLEAELRHALAADELRLYIQPRFSLAGGQLTSYEALLRWQHPERGVLTPASFLAGAEQAGLMPTIDRWVLQEVTRQLGFWNASERRERLSCNVSAARFQNPDFISTLEANLSVYSVLPQQLELEITENVLMQDLQRAADTLRQLKALLPGLRVAIDDFGSGYSSLAYLRHLPVDTLKIDQAFIRDLDLSSAQQQRTALAVIRTVVALGHDLGFRIVAEGAETEAQLKMLIALGVDEVQGYLLGKPRPLSDATLEPLTLSNVLSGSLEHR